MVSLLSRLGGHSKRETVTGSNEDTKVNDLRSKAAEMTSLDTTKINLIYSGKLLQDDNQTLAAAGLKASSVVYVLKKPNHTPVTPMEPKTLTEKDIQAFFIAFGMAARNPAINLVIKRMTDRDNLESLAAACPGLAQDPVALALLSKPEVLLMLLKPQILEKIAKKHPSLCEAMTNLAAAVHEENPTAVSDAVPAPLAYMDADLDEVEEDDDMDDEMDMNEGGARGGGGIQRNRSFSTITPDQLAAALMAAQNSMGGAFGGAGGESGGGGGGLFGMPGTASNNLQQSAASGPSSSNTSGNSSARTNPITSDMFRTAMAQAMAATSSAFGGGGSSAMDTSGSGATPATPSAEDTMTANLAKMKEMGIVDEGLAKKALKVMGGDLQAAIDLIFSGWLGDDDSDS